MTEEATPIEPPFKADEIDETLKRLSIRGACPMCGTSHWFVMQNERGHLGAIPWSKQDGNIYMTGVPLLVLACGKCGYILQFAAQNFRYFMEETRGKD